MTSGTIAHIVIGLMISPILPPPENENLIFRGNTFATKAVDTYMKMVGEMVKKLYYPHSLFLFKAPLFYSSTCTRR